VTLVRYRRRVWQQLQTVSPDLRNAVVATVLAVENDEIIYRFRDAAKVFYKPVLGYGNTASVGLVDTPRTLGDVPVF
jgi:hypothetical protein